MSKDKIEVNMNVYDIPILVEALEEANKEIERLKGALQTHEILLQSNTKEIERLHSIIKEVREYIENNTRTGRVNKDKKYFKLPNQATDILEIIDKINKE